MTGFAGATFSALVAVVHANRESPACEALDLGLAPLVTSVCLQGSMAVFSIGILGEAIGTPHTHVCYWPLILDKECFDFD